MNEDVFHLGLKALVRNTEGEILLLKADTTGFKDNMAPFWDLPGGRIQHGETVETGLVREVSEEIGEVELKNIKPINMVLSNHRIPNGDSSFGLILGIFSCELTAEVEIQVSDEHLEFGWFPPAEAAKLLEVKYPKEFTEKIAVV